MTAQVNDANLLQALQAAHEAGNEEDAIKIAAMLSARPVDPVVGTNTSGGAPAAPKGPAPYGWKDAFGPVEAGARMATGTLAAPISGLAGMGAAATHALGLTDADPADVVNKVGNAMTYDPRTRLGQETSGVIDDVAGLPARGADAAGRWTADKTGSPLLGAAVNTGLQGASMLAGAKLPAVATAAGKLPIVKPALSFASDMLPGGADRAASRLMQQYAGGPGKAGDASAALADHVAAQQALDAAGKSGSLATKYGIHPTTAQLAGNEGLAQLDRTIRNQGGDVAQPLLDRDSVNENAIRNILEGISGTPEQRLRASTARDFKARTAYDDALNNPEHFVPPPSADTPSFAAEEAAKKGLTQDGKPAINDPNAPATGLNDIGMRLQDLLKRPAMSDAMNNASRIAANFGKTVDDRNLIQQMHYAKMHLDDQIGAAKASGKTNDLNALLDTKRTLLGVMDDLSPAYKQARQSFQVDSAPMNRMDVGEEFRQKYLSALADAGGTGTRPAMFSDALRHGDQVAQRATNFGGATLNGTLTADDIAGLNTVNEQLGRQQFGQNAGRAVGSNTGQNIVNQRAMDNVGALSSINEDMGHAGNVALAIHNPVLAVGQGLRGAGVRKAAQAKLAEAAVDPRLAMKYLDRAPSRTLSEQIPEDVTIPAQVGAQENQQDAPAGHADGGSIDPPIHKTTFWELAQQALKEMTSPSDPPAPRPNTSGYVASGRPGADFDRSIDAQVQANGG